MSWPDEIPLVAELAQFITALEGSSIDGTVSWQGGTWRGGATWHVRLADQQTGVFAEGTFKGLEEALQYMRQRAIERFPSSDFAAEYKPKV